MQRSNVQSNNAINTQQSAINNLIGETARFVNLTST
jgi:hypothetical protein